MNNYTQRTLKWAGLCLSLLTAPVWAFESGSTGADGALRPTEDVTITMPIDGMLQYSAINIPAGITVRFMNNPDGPVTPATILVQGDATINGVIDISGRSGNDVFPAVLLAAGSYAGGAPQVGLGATGQGPGGGSGTVNAGGLGGSYGALGGTASFDGTAATSIYGSISLQPLLGGSGGGTARREAGVPLNIGAFGGGGGGALLLAVSDTLTLNGSILANGGRGSPLVRTAGITRGSGGGSGGGVRLVASLLQGAGSINISGGLRGLGVRNLDGGNGGHGRARLEGDEITFSGTVTPNTITSVSLSTPEPIIPANFPTVRISSVAGNAVPANPTGANDIVLPSTLSNPVTVELAATQVPTGSTIELSLVPTTSGNRTTVTSGALTGSLENSTASVQVTLPSGASTLLASVNFVVTPSTAALYAPFAEGEQVAQVTIESALGGGPSIMTLVTESGRVIEVPAYASL